MLKHHTEQRDVCEGQWKIFTLAQGLNFFILRSTGRWWQIFCWLHWKSTDLQVYLTFFPKGNTKPVAATSKDITQRIHGQSRPSSLLPQLWSQKDSTPSKDSVGGAISMTHFMFHGTDLSYTSTSRTKYIFWKGAVSTLMTNYFFFSLLLFSS